MLSYGDRGMCSFCPPYILLLKSCEDKKECFWTYLYVAKIVLIFATFYIYISPPPPRRQYSDSAGVKTIFLIFKGAIRYHFQKYRNRFASFVRKIMISPSFNDEGDISQTNDGDAATVTKGQSVNAKGPGDCNGTPRKDLDKKVLGFENVKEEDATQYLNNYKAHKTGITYEEMVKVYTEWANNYDKDLCPGRYNGPEIAAEFMAKHYAPEIRNTVKILDVAAGTGRVGCDLHKLGFREIDALEPSPGMLNVLKGRNIYKVTFENAIGFKKVDSIPTDAYDALVIAGGMGEGHIPVSAVDEMIRIVRPGGTIFIVMREEYLSYVQEYVGKLEPYMNDLAEQGVWKQVGRTIVEEYSFKKNGVVFAYEVSEKK